MNLFSTSAFLIWVSCLFAAYFSAKRGRFSLSLFFLTAAALVIRLFAAADPWLHFWDERYHFLVAKNMLENPFQPVLYKLPLLDYDYRAWSQNHIWVHKPPMALWLIAGSFKVFGVSELAGRLPSVFMSSAAVVLVYQVGLHFLRDRWLALACAFFQSVNGLTIELAAGRNPTDHVDTVFYFFILAGIWNSTRFAHSGKVAQAALTGVFLGLAVLTKWWVGLIIIPVFFILTLQKTGWKRALGWSILVLSTGLLIALPWQVYIHLHFPLEAAWESRFNLLHFTEVLEGHVHPWWFFLDRARTNWNELIYPAWLFFAYLLMKNRSRPEYWAIAIWSFLPYLVFSAAMTKMQGYILFTAPAQFMILALFLGFLSGRFNTRMGWAFRFVFAAVILLGLRYGYERARFFWPPEAQAAMNKDIKALTTQLDEKTVVFNTPYFIEIMFYTPAIAYERMPTEEDLNKLTKAGYQIRYAVLAEGHLKLMETPGR